MAFQFIHKLPYRCALIPLIYRQLLTSFYKHIGVSQPIGSQRPFKELTKPSHFRHSSGKVKID